MQTDFLRDAVRAAQSQRAAERRSSLENPQTPLFYPAEWLLDIFNGGRTDSGLRVSELTALQVSDVYACVDLISSAIASQPLKIYERIEIGEKLKRHGKRLATEHPLFDMLRYRPNDEMTRFVFFKTYVCHALLWSNAYAEIERDSGGRTVALWPRNPSRTRPKRTSEGTLVYSTTDGVSTSSTDPNTGADGIERLINKENMLFLPGLSLDGRLGQDVVWLARQLIGLALASEKYAAKFFGNGAAPQGLLTIPGMMTPEKKLELRKSWMEAQGGENRHRTAVLEGGTTYSKIGSTPSEAQMIEGRRLNRSQVASLFHVPLTMLGETGTAKANAEQVALEFVNYTLAPWVVGIEEELKVKLFEPAKLGRNAGKTFFALIDTRRLTLPDAQSKQQFYSAGRQWGILNPNDILELEDMNPITGAFGESRLVPVNMVPIDDDGQPISFIPATENDQKQKLQPGPGKTANPPQVQNVNTEEDEAQQARQLLYPLFRDAFGRMLAREAKNRDAENVRRIFGSVVTATCTYMKAQRRSDRALEVLNAGCANWMNQDAESQAAAAFDAVLQVCKGD